MAQKKPTPYGPKMLAITQMQRKYVRELFARPGISHAGALRAAGYKNNDDACKALAYRWFHRPDVGEAIAEWAHTEYRNKLPLAVGVVDDEMRNPKSRNRVAVAHHLLDTTGVASGPVQQVHVTHNVSVDDMKQQLRMLLAKPVMQALLPTMPAFPGETSKAIEAEYVEVKADDE